MFESLKKDQLSTIHTATLEILENLGLKIGDAQALDILKEAGANVDIQNKVVKLPQNIVEEGIKKAPESFTLGATNPKNDLIIKRGNTYVRPGTGYNRILDIDSGKLREPTLRDVEDCTILTNELENISFGATHILPTNVQPKIADIHALKIILTNTEKHNIFSPLKFQNFTLLRKMSIIFNGGEEEFKRRPLTHVIISPTSPLKIGEDPCKELLDCTKYKMPIILCSCPLCGATGPASLAGILALQNAEMLALNTLAQISSPGTPVIYAPRAVPIDMRSGILSWGSPEATLLSAAAIQIGHYYNLPVDVHGSVTNSKTMDEQAGIEKSFSANVLAYWKPEIISGAGVMETDGNSSLTQLVIDDEIYGIMHRILKGIEINQETLALDIISKVGYEGNYLGEKHTRDHYSKEHRFPELFNTQTRNSWEKNGSADISQIAKNRVKSILKETKSKKMDSSIEEEIQKIMIEAKKIG